MRVTNTNQDIVRRFEDNPVIGLDHLSFPVTSICNAAAVEFKGEILLLVTIEHLRGTYSIFKATSSDGFRFNVDDKPFLKPSHEYPFAKYEASGVMDARITYLDNTYYIVYNTLSHYGYRLALARTEDFRSVKRICFLSEPDTKAGALFPKKIDGKYTLLHRPWDKSSIWIGYSNDLIYWGWARAVMTPRSHFWDSSRIGPAGPPIETEDGWLVVYYGIKETSAGPLFRLGAATLDLDDPTKVLSRSNIPILSPRQSYERIGDIPNLVYSCGAIEQEGKLKIYYGASNSCISVGQVDIKDIIDLCCENEQDF